MGWENGNKLLKGALHDYGTNWAAVVAGKKIAVDVSVLMHAFLEGVGRKKKKVDDESRFDHIKVWHQILCVDKDSSALYLIAEQMQKWFVHRHLYMAKLVVFVFDPKYVNSWHCRGCKENYDEHIKVKYGLSQTRRYAANKQADAAQKFNDNVKKIIIKKSKQKKTFLSLTHASFAVSSWKAPALLENQW